METLPTVINVQVTVSYVVEGVLDSLDEEDQNLEGVLNWIEQNAEEDLSQCIGNYNVLDENGQVVGAEAAYKDFQRVQMDALQWGK